MQVDEETCLIVTRQYHTEEDPETGKTARGKSAYRWLGRVWKLSDMRAMGNEMFSDAKRLLPWHWPNDPTWKGRILTSDSTNYQFSKWISCKIGKMTSWENGQKLLAGWSKKEQCFKPKDAYPTENYLTESGTTVSLKSKEDLLKHVNENIWLPIERTGLKRSNAKAVLPAETHPADSAASETSSVPEA